MPVEAEIDGLHAVASKSSGSLYRIHPVYRVVSRAGENNRTADYYYYVIDHISVCEACLTTCDRSRSHSYVTQILIINNQHCRNKDHGI